MNRHLSRMVAMQTIYEWSFRDSCDIDEVLVRNIHEYEDDIDEDYVRFVVTGAQSKIKELDDLIGKSAPEWPLEQISLIDKSILRIAIFELMHSPNVPAKVAINEAVELAKQFGGENSSKFINGVLGTVYDTNEKQVLSSKKEE